MMDCKKVNRIFRVVCLKGVGAYADFGTDVPKLAQRFLTRVGEIDNHSGTEIALFEPKRNTNHLKGHYYVGLIVNETLTNVPVGLDFIETAQDHVTTRGNILHIKNLHKHLLKWSDDQDYKRDLESHIVETYHPLDNGEEEVEIYLPIHI